MADSEGDRMKSAASTEIGAEKLYECPYCGGEKPSPNGTGSDVSCCGEVGHSLSWLDKVHVETMAYEEAGL